MATYQFINTLIFDYQATMNMISIQDVATCCLSDACLTPELVYQLKQLTSNYHQNFNSEKATLCIQCWKLIGRSVRFWENIGLLLNQSLGYETNLQALILTCERVKTNWHNEDDSLKNSIKQYLCSQSQTYSNGEMTMHRKSLYRKINQILVEILKFEWSNKWSNFLCGICEAMFDNYLYAQNYFDLLHAIFTEIFSEQDYLIAEEVEALKAQVLNYYNHLQKCFEKYLQVQTPPNILRNCVLALSSLVEWIPPFYIFIGTIIDQLYDLVQHSNCKQQAITCLLTILNLSNEQLTQTLLPKIYAQKRKILLQLLPNPTVFKNKSVLPKLMYSSLKFLQDQKKDIENHGIKLVMGDSDQANANKYIMQNLIKIMEECEESLDIHKDDVIILYKLIVMMGKEDVVELQKIIDNVIQITPQSIECLSYKGETARDGDLEETRKNFLEIMENLLSNQYENYFNYIFKQIDGDYISHKSYKRLEKILNNIYYCLEKCPPHIQIKQKVFIIISRLLNIEEKIAKSQPMQNLPKLAKTIKLGMHLILGHQKCRNTILQIPVYLKYLEKAFIEDKEFILSLLNIISKNYSHFQAGIKNHLHQQYVKGMATQDDRLEADLMYLEIVGKWVDSNQKENIEVGLQYTVDIVDGYRNTIAELKNRKLTTIRKSQIVEYEQKLFSITLEYLQLIHTSLPHLKSELVYHIYPELPIIEQIKSIINLSDTNPDSILFFKLALRILMWNFSMLNKDQINKNLDIILKQCEIVIDHITRDLQADKACQENIGSMLDYLSQFLISVGDWSIENAQKVSISKKIIGVVLARGYSYEMPGYGNFLHSTIKCSTLALLPPQVLSTTISLLFRISTCEQQSYIVECLKIMETIFTECIANAGKQKMLSIYILDCIKHTYMILVKLLYVRHFIQEYSDILFMGLAFVKNMKQKFTCNGLEVVSNIHTVIGVLIETTRSINQDYSEAFMEKISKFLSSIVLDINSKKVFCDRVKDLVVILRRGY